MPASWNQKVRMPKYCLDSDIFIRAKNGPYGFDIVPGFWKWLDLQIEAGTIFSPDSVYDELKDRGDELSRWIRDRKNSSFFMKDEDVQPTFRLIADYVNQNFPLHNASKFLAGADPWLIAHAKDKNAIVVTHEQLVGANSQQVKIPNVCRHFDVNFTDPYKMLRTLNARFDI